MTVLQATVLGIVQGLTEFLPVSSSGHLVLAHYYFGWGDSLGLWVDIATNTGTLLAVLLYLHRDVWSAMRGFAGGLVSAEARRGEGWHLALLVIVASVPTAILALALKGVFEHLNTPVPVSIALIITGFILWFAPRSGPKGTPRQVTFLDALIGGLVQGIAVIPGLSRSGTTIAALLARGVDKELAPRLSFLMYLVVSLGVAILGVGDVREAGVEAGPLLAMLVASFVTGLLALRLLFALLRSGRFRVFSPYLWVVGGLTLLWALLS